MPVPTAPNRSTEPPNYPEQGKFNLSRLSDVGWLLLLITVVVTTTISIFFARSISRASPTGAGNLIAVGIAIAFAVGAASVCFSFCSDVLKAKGLSAFKKEGDNKNWYLEVIKRSAMYSGRACRREFWVFFLINLIIAFLLGFIEGLVVFIQELAGGPGVTKIFCLVVLIPTIPLAVRRLHDTGRSGWWLLINFVPLIGNIVILVFMGQDSQGGENQYGPNPKGVAAQPPNPVTLPESPGYPEEGTPWIEILVLAIVFGLLIAFYGFTIVSGVLTVNIGAFFMCLVAVLIFLDARQAGIHKKKGHKSLLNNSPLTWGIVTVLLFVFTYPLYAFSRNRLKTKSGNTKLFVVLNVFGVAVMGMFLWWLAWRLMPTRVPAPALVVLFDLGQGNVQVMIGGLFVAIVGVLVFLYSRNRLKTKSGNRALFVVLNVLGVAIIGIFLLWLARPLLTDRFRVSAPASIDRKTTVTTVPGTGGGKMRISTTSLIRLDSSDLAKGSQFWKTLAVSPDSRRVAYVAKSGRKSVVVDGVEGKLYDSILFFKKGERSILFSPDGERVAYVAKRSGKQLVVVDGVEGKSYDGVGSGSLVFSPDSKRVAYWVMGKRVVVVDGVEGNEYDGYGGLVFSPDSKRVAYFAGRRGKLVVVVDGVEGNEYDGIGGGLFFSPDSQRVAYVAQRGRKWVVVVDGVEGTGYDGIMEFRSWVFSPDSQRVAYGAKRGRKWIVVVNGVEVKECDGILDGTPFFSPDSKRVAYGAGAERRGKFVVVVDGLVGNEYDGIGPLIFSPDSKRVVYFAQRGRKWVVVVNGVEGKECDGILDGSLVFGPDSKRMAHVAKRGRKWVVVVNGPSSPSVNSNWWISTPDGVEGRESDGIFSLVFSPDGRRIAYIAERGGKTFVVVDGVERYEYDTFLPGSKLVFDSPNSLHTLALRDGEILRVEIEIIGEVPTLSAIDSRMKLGSAAKAEFDKQKAASDQHLGAGKFKEAAVVWSKFPGKFKTESIKGLIDGELKRIEDAPMAVVRALAKEAEPLLAKKAADLKEDDLALLKKLQDRIQNPQGSLTDEALSALKNLSVKLSGKVAAHQELLAARQAKAFRPFWQAFQAQLRKKDFGGAESLIAKQGDVLERELKALLSKDTTLLKSFFTSAAENLPKFKGRTIRIGGIGMKVMDVKDGKVIVKQGGAEMAWEMSRLELKALFPIALSSNVEEASRQKMLLAFFYGSDKDAVKSLTQASAAGLDVAFYQARLVPVLIVMSKPSGAAIELYRKVGEEWEKVDTGDLTTPHRMEADKNTEYKIEVLKKGYQLAFKEVTVSEGGEFRLSLALKKQRLSSAFKSFVFKDSLSRHPENVPVDMTGVEFRWYGKKAELLVQFQDTVPQSGNLIFWIDYDLSAETGRRVYGDIGTDCTLSVSFANMSTRLSSTIPGIPVPSIEATASAEKNQLKVQVLDWPFRAFDFVVMTNISRSERTNLNYKWNSHTRNIQVDGEIEDWNAQRPFWSAKTPIPSKAFSYFDIRSLWMANDHSTLFLRLEFPTDRGLWGDQDVNDGDPRLEYSLKKLNRRYIYWGANKKIYRQPGRPGIKIISKGQRMEVAILDIKQPVGDLKLTLRSTVQKLDYIPDEARYRRRGHLEVRITR